MRWRDFDSACGACRVAGKLHDRYIIDLVVTGFYAMEQHSVEIIQFGATFTA